MTRPLLPPRGIFVGSGLLFDRQMTPTVRDTLLQLMALAWSSASHQTPPLTISILQTLTRKSPRTLRAHLALLRSYPDVLRLQPAGKGQFTVTLAGWLYGQAGGKAKEGRRHRKGSPRLVNGEENGEFLPGERERPPYAGQNRPMGGVNIKEEEEDSNYHGAILPLPEQARRKPKQARTPSRHLSAGLEETLREAGVFPGLLPELAQLARRDGRSEDDLRALLAWCQDDEPRQPAALFVARLRIGARVPAAYRQPACPRCGLRGGHSPECPRRYAMDGA